MPVVDEALVIERMVNHIGRPTILAVSGGRVHHSVRDALVILPIRYGYAVEVRYEAGRDLYAVERVFTRGAKRFVKESVTHVFAEDLADTVYRLSCWN